MQSAERKGGLLLTLIHHQMLERPRQRNKKQSGLGLGDTVLLNKC
jgi:hypothetical protein